MMRSVWMVGWLVGFGVLASACGGDPMAGQPDSGPGIDGGEDVALCGRDADCSDDRFCNGEERCIPGEPGADARGCVVFPAPCEVDECDEDMDACRVCSEPDADDDNVPSIPCGGTDCDDTRGDVHPGALEVCDAEGIDEDCNSDTLGTDADGDGAYAPECCYQPADGPLVCGRDCDDSDDAIGPDAPERCNGIDDDCDGMIDEDFDCVQSQVVTGLNACGREGTRRCSETCTWLDDTFSRAESASTCDYCDDSGDGLGDEIPFAMETNRAVIDSALERHGDADFACSFLFGEVYCHRFVVSESDDRGGFYSPTPMRLGFGPTRVWARINSLAKRTAEDSHFGALGGAWALVILQGPPASFVGPGHGGLPESSGMAVMWSFSSFIVGCPGCPQTPDSLSLYELQNGTDSRWISTARGLDNTQDGPMGESLAHSIWVEITPDDPRTVQDESALTVLAPIGVGLRCANDGAVPCGIRFDPGTELRVGVTASSTSTNDIGVTVTNVQVDQFGLCSP